MSEKADKKSDLKLPPEILDLLTGKCEIELEDVDIEVDEIEFVYQPGVIPAIQRLVAATKGKPTSLVMAVSVSLSAKMVLASLLRNL